MITLDASLKDLHHQVEYSDVRIRAGQAFIEPFATRHLTTNAREREIWVGEEPDPVPDTVGGADALRRTREITGFDGVRIILDRAGFIEIARTSGGSTPLYLAADRDHMVASWKFEAAVAVLGCVRPDVDMCRLYLEHGQGRTRNQIINGVYMLWPGEAARFDDKGLTFSCVPSPAIIMPSALAEGAHATDDFVELIGADLANALDRAESVLVEVSGGLDSSCVAVAARRIRAKLSSYGVTQPGIVGAQQSKRRRELVDLLGLDDYECPAGDCSPFSSFGHAEFCVTPYDDLYRMPCISSIDTHPGGRFDLVLTGIGGDELTKESTFGRFDWEVPGVQCTSAIVAAVCRADMFMRRAIWPKNPLVSIDVLNFCRALPPGIRNNRQLNTLTLARAGLSDGFLFPRYYENWAPTLSRDGIYTDFDRLFSESVIGDFGIGDVSGLLSKARNNTLLGLSVEVLSELYNWAKLEFVLRRYVG